MSGKPTKFLTLTIKDRPVSPAEQALLLSDALRKLIKRWKRHKRGAEIEYCAVFEPHPSSGRPHLHIMLRAPYTRQQWLSRQMTDLLDSPIVDIRAITDRRKVARYVAKYITKSNTRFGSAKRYWCSKKYELDKPEPSRGDDLWGSGWHIWQEPLWLLAQTIARMRMTITWDGDHAFSAVSGLDPPPFYRAVP